MTEMGKLGKLMGVPLPRDARRVDREPPIPPQKASGRKPPRKRYGFSYQRRMKESWVEPGMPRRWHKRTHWSYYETEKQRDQAMRQMAIGDTFHEVRNCTPVDR